MDFIANTSLFYIILSKEIMLYQFSITSLLLFYHCLFYKAWLTLFFAYFLQIDGIRANYSGSMVSLTDICLKPLGQDCATQSVLQVLCMVYECIMLSACSHLPICFS